MRKLIIVVIIFVYMVFPVHAMEFTAPEVPESGREMFPEKRSTFGEDLTYILQKALREFQPAMVKTIKVCCGVLSASLMISIFGTLSGNNSKSAELGGTIVIAGLLIQSTGTLIRLGTNTVFELSQYGKLLIPVMTAALAAQGGTTASTGLFAATVLFDGILTSLISKLLIPIVYIYLALAVAHSAIGQNILQKLLKFIKSLMTWCLKTILYVFTGYISITGVISGSVDAAAIKAAKLTISGVVPVVGGILSDASEAVLVSAGMMKSAAGIYGILSFVAIGIGPFLQIAAQYLLLKGTSAVTAIYEGKKLSALVEEFSTVMGFVLGMTGATAFILMISTVCFMRGIG